jgi:hypothetical protein
MDLGQLLTQLWALIQGFAAMDTSTKIMSIVLLLIAVWKSSILQPYWAWFGKGQILVAPALAVIVAVLSVHPFSWAALWMSLVGGALAVATHELLDAAKNIPGLGPQYVSLIAFFASLFQAPQPVQAAVQAKKAELVAKAKAKALT